MNGSQSRERDILAERDPMHLVVTARRLAVGLDQQHGIAAPRLPSVPTMRKLTPIRTFVC